MPFEEFTQKVLEKFDISLDVMKMHYTLKFNLRAIKDLEDEDDLDKVVSHSDDHSNSSRFDDWRKGFDVVQTIHLMIPFGHNTRS